MSNSDAIGWWFLAWLVFVLFGVTQFLGDESGCLNKTLQEP